MAAICTRCEGVSGHQSGTFPRDVARRADAPALRKRHACTARQGSRPLPPGRSGHRSLRAAAGSRRRFAHHAHVHPRADWRWSGGEVLAIQPAPDAGGYTGGVAGYRRRGVCTARIRPRWPTGSRLMAQIWISCCSVVPTWPNSACIGYTRAPRQRSPIMVMTCTSAAWRQRLSLPATRRNAGRLGPCKRSETRGLAGRWTCAYPFRGGSWQWCRALAPLGDRFARSRRMRSMKRRTRPAMPQLHGKRVISGPPTWPA